MAKDESKKYAYSLKLTNEQYDMVVALQEHFSKDEVQPISMALAMKKAIKVSYDTLCADKTTE